jgi:glycosyltransferase involved in cell wall biosynthesis
LPTVDISIVLNLHREGKYLLRTLRSLQEASDFARAEGLKLELIAVLDLADELTKRLLFEFDAGRFERFTCIEVGNGSLGPSRNDGAALALGKYILFCDGDDLVSFNYISACFHAAERRGRRAIVVPEWMFEFDANYCVIEYCSLDRVTPLAFVDIHPYVSKIFVHRDIFGKNRFSDVRLTAGFAYEDWHFNANAVGLGYTFEVARDAIVFYRVRRGSLLRQADQLSVRQIPPSKLFEPEVFLRVCARAEAALRGGFEAAVRLRGKAFLESPVCQYLIAAANQIDPKVELNQFRRGAEWFPIRATSRAPGQAYYELCARLVGLRFDHVFLVPNFGVGGAERYFINVINGLTAGRPDEPVLLLLGEPHPDNAWLSRLPDGVVVLDLAPYLPKVGAEGVDLLALKIIQHVAVGAALHVRQSAFGQRFVERYGRALDANRVLFYYFCEERKPIEDFVFAQPWSFPFLSEHIEFIDVIVADNLLVGRVDQGRLGFGDEKWRFLPTLHDPPVSREEATARVNGAERRLLWASRMTWQKRPTLIRPIAAKLAQACPDLSIDVYGAPTEDFDPAVLLGISNVDYRGTYSDFSGISGDGYLAFLYTSLFDGIPTVLLEAAGMGLPVIAPDVSAVDEFVVHGETGLLLASVLDDDEMAALYVRAVVRLREDPELRRRLIAGSYDRVISTHSTTPYLKALKEVLRRS